MPKKKVSKVSKRIEEIRKIAWKIFRDLTLRGKRVSYSKWWDETRREAKCSWDNAKEAINCFIDSDSRVREDKEKGGETRYFFYQQTSKRAGLKPSAGSPSVSSKEPRLYPPVVEWIKREEKGCTAAILGNQGKKSGLSWWTPDVVAILRPPDNIQGLHFSPEVISVEIKADGEHASVITGFGQACAYKVFSHKSYFVVPESAIKEERLLPLCDIFGIWLIRFRESSQGPVFTGYSRARSHQPSIHHVDEFLKGLREKARTDLGLKMHLG